MPTDALPYKNVDEYIALQKPEIQPRLEELRKIIRDAAPEATEKISWAMPTFFLSGNLVHFAAAKSHVGFYPGGCVELFADKLTDYHTSKGGIQFPYAKPLPEALIREIIAYRVGENRKRKEK